MTCGLVVIGIKKMFKVVLGSNPRKGVNYQNIISKNLKSVGFGAFENLKALRLARDIITSRQGS